MFLNDQDKDRLHSWVTTVGANSLLATLFAAAVLGIITILAIILVWGVQVHDKIYDKLIIKWRESYDVEFILTRFIEPIKADLPENFPDFARKYKYEFMKPFYEFVGDGQPGIAENTRIRFYERITWYWVTQLNEIFILFFLLWSPIFLIINRGNSSVIFKTAIFITALIVVGILNRWIVRISRQAVRQATLDEIEEVLAKPGNIRKIKSKYTKLCRTYRL